MLMHGANHVRMTMADTGNIVIAIHIAAPGIVIEPDAIAFNYVDGLLVKQRAVAHGAPPCRQ